MATINKLWCEFEKATLSNKCLSEEVLADIYMAFVAGLSDGIRLHNDTQLNNSLPVIQLGYIVTQDPLTIYKENKCS